MLPFSIMSKYGQVQPEQGQIKKVVAYSSSVMVLLQNGNLYARGTNTAGIFGDGSASGTVYTGAWRLINTGVKEFWSNFTFSLCIGYDGKYYSSGTIRGLTGSTALATTVWTDRSSYFTNIDNPDNIAQVELSNFNFYVLMANGSVYTSGSNGSGQHGYGNTTLISNGPQLNPNFINIKKIGMSASNGTETFYALDTSGNIYGCGNSSHGELLTTTTLSTKKLLTTGVIDVAFGNYCFLCTKSDGIYVGGSQFNGQLGDGVNSSTIGTVGRTTLYKLPGYSTPPDHIFSLNYTSVIFYGTSYYAAGRTINGSLGVNVSTSTFTSMDSGTPVIDPSYGYVTNSNNAYIVSTSGYLYGCGSYNASTDILPGYTTDRYTLSILSTAGIV